MAHHSRFEERHRIGGQLPSTIPQQTPTNPSPPTIDRTHREFQVSRREAEGHKVQPLCKEEVLSRPCDTA